MTTEKLVGEVLRDSPNSRNSDRVLLGTVYERLGFVMTPEQKKIFMELPAAETITRSRREYQIQGMYPASKEVDERRFKKFKEVRGGDRPKYNIDRENRTVQILS